MIEQFGQKTFISSAKHGPLNHSKSHDYRYSSVDFVDASTALVHVHDGSQALLDVRMHRSGLSWKVVGFSVPEGRADH